MPTDIASLIKSLRKLNITGLNDCVVREIDETAVGVFEGYVDEKDRTFDVSYKISGGKTLTAYKCDCDQKGICRHIAACLLNAPQHEKLAGKKAKKIPASAALLENLTATELKEWLLEILPKQKDLELSFIQRFSENSHEADPAQVREMTANAVRAVLGRKRIMDAGAAKKLVTLWKQIHQPLMDAYLKEPWNPLYFNNFLALLAQCNSISITANTNSNQLHNYVFLQTERATDAVQAIKDPEHWKASVELMIRATALAENDLKIQLVILFAKLLVKSPMSSRTPLVPLAMEVYRGVDPHHLRSDASISMALLAALYNHPLMEQYIGDFKPVRYQNNYNLALIQALVHLKKYELAEEYAWQQVNNNSYNQYDEPYLKVLHEISRITGNKEKLVPVLRQSIPLSLVFDDYEQLMALAGNDPLQVTFRNQLVASLRHPSRGRNLNSQLFLFNLMAYEQNFQKMLEYVNDDTYYFVLAEHLDHLLATNADGFLLKLLNRPDVNLYQEPQDVARAEGICAGQIVAKLVEVSGHPELERTVAARYINLPNNRIRNHIRIFGKS